MEGVSTVKQLIRKGDFMAKLDLKDAYLTIPVFPAHRVWLCFKWGGKTFEFVSLPFGLSSAAWAFTKILRPAIAHLRRLGIRLVVYLDDILIVHSSEVGARKDARIVRGLLESLGFSINEEKSIEIPAQSMEYIGIMIHSTSMSFTLTEKKSADLKNLCIAVVRKESISLRELASLLGNFNWASQAVPFAQAHIRGLQALYIAKLRQAQGDYSSLTRLDKESKNDLCWWVRQADFTIGRPIILSKPSISIYSDSSLTGWGAVCNGVRTGGPWTSAEEKSHINELEILAALKALECFTASSKDLTVELFLDNTTAVSYVNKLGGSRSSRLCSIALRIARWCEGRNIELFAVYLPGSDNVIADAESRRQLSSADWKLAPRAFKSIQQRWKVKVDLFASEWNAQLPKYVSWFPQPGAWKTEAFSFSWTNLEGYAFPPFNLIPNCLSKVRQDQASLILVTPYWPSQSWFPSALEMSTDFPLCLSPCQDILTSPTGTSHPLAENDSIRLIAWNLSGIVSRGKAFRRTLSDSCWLQQGKIQTPHTNLPGRFGAIGAFDGMLIPCLSA
jgi:hypothetical protein